MDQNSVFQVSQNKITKPPDFTVWGFCLGKGGETGREVGKQSIAQLFKIVVPNIRHAISHQRCVVCRIVQIVCFKRYDHFQF